MTATRDATVEDRKALRAAAIDLHRIASSIRDRRGLVPTDEPKGYLDAFVAELRAMARVCEGARGVTASGVKRLVAEAAEGADAATAEGLARTRAVNALTVTVNLHALRNGVDPYEGMGT